MTSQYGACALHAGSTMLHARTRMHTPTSPGTHARKRARACMQFCFFTATMIRELALILGFMHIPPPFPFRFA